MEEKTKLRWMEPVVDFIAGTGAGFLGKLVEYPFDTVKVRLQTSHSSSIGNTLTEIYSSGGISAFYRGIPVPLAGTMLETACLFTSMTQIKHFLYPNQHNFTVSEIATAGAGAGFVTSFLLTPIELVKVRMQTSNMYRHSWHCVADSFKREGITFLYRLVFSNYFI